MTSTQVFCYFVRRRHNLNAAFHVFYGDCVVCQFLGTHDTDPCGTGVARAFHLSFEAAVTRVLFRGEPLRTQFVRQHLHGAACRVVLRDDIDVVFRLLTESAALLFHDQDDTVNPRGKTNAGQVWAADGL